MASAQPKPISNISALIETKNQSEKSRMASFNADDPLSPIPGSPSSATIQHIAGKKDSISHSNVESGNNLLLYLYI